MAGSEKKEAGSGSGAGDEPQQPDDEVEATGAGSPGKGFGALRLTTEQQVHLPPRRQLHVLSKRVTAQPGVRGEPKERCLAKGRTSRRLGCSHDGLVGLRRLHGIRQAIW